MSKLDGIKKRKEREKNNIDNLTAKDWHDCLEFFNYKDAYTGLELYDTTRDHVIPVTKNGGNTRNNIVPCNREVNTSKLNYDLLEWYPTQTFFSEDRLKKIFDWMGEYAKYLNRHKLPPIIDKPKGGSIQRYSIILPNGYKKNIYYSTSSSDYKKTLIIYDILLKKWEEYCITHWLWNRKYTLYFNYEDKVKNFLDRCGSFILLRKNTENGILSKRKTEQLMFNEIPVSSVGMNVEDIIYSLNNNDSEEEYTYNAVPLESYINISDVDDIENSIKSGRMNKKDIKKIQKNKKKSVNRLLKIIDIYHKEEKVINEKYKLTNFDVYSKNKLDTTNLDKKWLNKNFKDVCGNNVFEYKKTVIKKNEGQIDKNKNYISEWCLVDTEGFFVFNNKKFQISSEVEQYTGVEVRSYDSRKKREYIDMSYEMDKILVFYQDGNYYFYDEKINIINNKYIYSNLIAIK